MIELYRFNPTISILSFPVSRSCDLRKCWCNKDTKRYQMFWLHQYMKFTSAFSINLFVWIPYCDIIWYNLRIKIILCAFSVKCTKAPNTGKLLYLTNSVFPLKHSRLHICTYATTIFTLILILSDRLSFLVNNYLRINPLSRSTI